MKKEFDFSEQLKFRWIQLINAILKDWKESTLEDQENWDSLKNHDNHPIKKKQIHPLNKLNSKVYNMQIYYRVNYYKKTYFAIL